MVEWWLGGIYIIYVPKWGNLGTYWERYGRPWGVVCYGCDGIATYRTKDWALKTADFDEGVVDADDVVVGDDHIGVFRGVVGFSDVSLFVGV